MGVLPAEDMVSEIAGRSIEVEVDPAFVRPCEVGLLYASRRKLEAMVGLVGWILDTATRDVAVDVEGEQPLKVVLSIDPVKFPLTGIGRYTYELARGLEGAGLEILRFLSGTRMCSSLPALQDNAPMAVEPAWQRFAKKNRIAVTLYRAAYRRLRRHALTGLEDHVFHGPNYFLPPFAGRSVVTFHDLSVYLWPEMHPPERVRLMRAEMELSLKGATALITDTEFTRREVADFFNWPLERIFAVPLASAGHFVPRSEEALRQALMPYRLKAKAYTLFTGTVEPRKNLGALLDAYDRLPADMRGRYPLVICGYRGWGSDELHKRIDRGQRAGWLRYLGFVPQDGLPLLMAGARLFVYPSLYEGFGLPVLEAMACGVPVVCSNASTLPEVAGHAAAFHAPEDVDALLTLLQAGLEDGDWQERASKAGLAQAAKFSWERCTKETIAVYAAAAAA